MVEERKSVAETVTKEIVGSIKGVGEVANALVDTVTRSSSLPGSMRAEPLRWFAIRISARRPTKWPAPGPPRNDG